MQQMVNNESLLPQGLLSRLCFDYHEVFGTEYRKSICMKTTEEQSARNGQTYIATVHYSRIDHHQLHRGEFCFVPCSAGYVFHDGVLLLSRAVPCSPLWKRDTEEPLAVVETKSKSNRKRQYYTLILHILFLDSLTKIGPTTI